jgi:hypothetical protein
MVTLVLTQEESQNLAQLLDLAVKAGGLQVAPAALPIFTKLKVAVEFPEQKD